MAFLDFLPMIGGALQTFWNSTVGQKQSKDLMNYQYQLNQQAVDAQNRYNSPIAQMERLRQAGLNPNLVYGNGVEGNQSSAPNVGIANRGNTADFNFNDVVNNVFKRRQIENETGIANATREKMYADKLLSLARYLDTLEDVARKDATFDTFVEQTKAELKKTNTQITNIEHDTDLKVQQENNLRIAAANLAEQTNLLVARTNLTREQAATEIVKRESLRAGIKLTNAQAVQVGHMIDYIDAGTDLRELEYDVKDLDFESTDELNKWLKDHPNVELTGEIIGYIMDKINSSPRGRSTRKRNKRKR